MCRFFAASLFTLLCIALPAIAQPSPSTRIMDDSAIAALVKMREFLGKQKSIYARTHGTVDYINETGLLIQEPYRSEVWIDRPNRFRFSSSGKNAPRDFFFDGKTLTLYDTDNKLYATMPLPGTNVDLFETLPRYGIEMPFSSLFRMDPLRPVFSGILEAIDLGKERIADTACRHYAYRQRDIDWQIWIPEQGLPLPIRLASVNRTLTPHPQYTANTQWEKKNQINDTVFRFTPPKDARQVALKEISEKKKKNLIPTTKSPLS